MNIQSWQLVDRERDVQVWATDLWFSASENLQRIRDAAVEDNVFPVHADARSLPFCLGGFGTGLGMATAPLIAILVNAVIPTSDRNSLQQMGLTLLAVAIGQFMLQIGQNLAALRVEGLVQRQVHAYAGKMLNVLEERYGIRRFTSQTRLDPDLCPIRPCPLHG